MSRNGWDAGYQAGLFDGRRECLALVESYSIPDTRTIPEDFLRELLERPSLIEAIIIQSAMLAKEDMIKMIHDRIKTNARMKNNGETK